MTGGATGGAAGGATVIGGLGGEIGGAGAMAQAESVSANNRTRKLFMDSAGKKINVAPEA